MTATEELRALLDARGVEWDYGTSGPDSTMFRANGVDLTFTPMRNRLVCSTILTPAQAVEATLGREVCRMEQIEEACYDDIECSECGVCLWGFQMDKQGEGVLCRPKFCPNCGREVVE